MTKLFLSTTVCCEKVKSPQIKVENYQDVLRFTHAGDECLTIPSTWSLESSETNIIVYEGQDDIYDSIATVGEIQVYRRADFQSGSRVLKKVS